MSYKDSAQMSADERLDERAALVATSFLHLKCRKGHPPTGDIGRTAGAFRGTTRSSTPHDKPGTLGGPGANAPPPPGFRRGGHGGLRADSVHPRDGSSSTSAPPRINLSALRFLLTGLRMRA